ncbi:MAG TPA: hypothetical protein VIS29_17030 [Streptomyces sp.]
MNNTPSSTSSSASSDSAVDDRDEETTATDDGTVPGPAAADSSGDGDGEAYDEADLEPDPYDEAEAAASAGVGAGATAVVAAGLGIVSLSGAWTGRVAAERETLLGQIKTSGGGSAAQQISEIYADAWHTTAFVNGLFALLALLAGVFVLVRPAFGAPAPHPQPGWIRAVARAGIALGVLGVLISVGMYFDLFVSLPDAPAATGAAQ